MLVQMQVTGIARDPITMMHVVILTDPGGDRILRIWIGGNEAEAIQRELEQIKAPRPMSHDLMRNLLKKLEANVTRIIINDLRNDTYYAQIEINHEGETHLIDSRPSDGIALAVRFKAPIFVHEQVLMKASGEHEGSERSDESEQLQTWLEKLKPEDFGKYKM